MKIAELQREIEESLASVPTSALPQALQGLRHLPLADCDPQVIIASGAAGKSAKTPTQATSIRAAKS